MTELEELRTEVAELREQLDSAARLIRWEARQRQIIELYLDTLTSTNDWKQWEKSLNRWFPFWGWLSAMRVLYREPFSVWASRQVSELSSDQGRGKDGKGQ